MRIRFVTPPLAKQAGGIENAVQGLRKALNLRGIEVLDGGSADDSDAIHHFHGLWDPTHSRLARNLRKRGRAYVVSPHGMLEPWAYRNRWWKKLPYFWLIERNFLTGAAAIFVTSEMEKDNLHRVLTHPCVEVLPLGARDAMEPAYEASRELLGWPQSDKVMLFLSRVDPKKGVHLLLDALAQLPETAHKWRLVIVGDGPAEYLAQLKKTQSLHGELLPRIDWIGAVWGEERWPYIQGADLFLLPTHSENFGIAVLEALHAGTPVLTTTGTPWRDHADLEGIFICDPTVDSLRDCLRNTLERLQARWSQNERNHLAGWTRSRFSWRVLGREYEKAYQRVHN
jgi:glycosyltransferase involved in cell wall biosynthesis